MTRFRLGWFCYILQKCEKKKRNQEDFVNTVLNKLVGEGNPKTSFIPEINRVSSNRLFTGEENVPEFYLEALPLTDYDFQTKRISSVLESINENEDFNYKQAVIKAKNELSMYDKDAIITFGSAKLEALKNAPTNELFIASLLIYLVNTPNIPQKDTDELRHSKIIQDNILKFLENEILLTPFSHRTTFEGVLANPIINQSYFIECYTTEALNNPELIGTLMTSSSLRLLTRDSIIKMPIIQNGFIIQNGSINERTQKFISEKFQTAPKVTLLMGLYQNKDEAFKAIDRYFPKEAIGKIFTIESMAVSIKSSYDYTAQKMKDMIHLTNDAVEYLENRNFADKDSIELTVGGVEQLNGGECLVYLLTKCI
ncbi:hypothetical protein NLY77_06100 [Streptococcus suis]|uniref:Uncharacterized protein n=2 Tax=Streptococcus suis TaxID=1307 RepID=A0A6L8MY99_STRSU|nr:hypothetical protein [Streptococcus suis]MCK3959719.1 hypothetical protein [Streptococcus suis]MCO8201669.1 hypothetical protein [Streptococcus suis]MYN70175.1 hypothetical protein [Streptococcus suis]NQK53687.1 hypothetical protein [Streptococcus suis]NQL49060.1 hypothetical protein [Streptococcus suis]